MYIQRIGILSQGGVAFPTTNLESYWRFDETSGTTVSDQVGGKTGTFTSGKAAFTASGKNNYYLNITDTSCKVDCGNSTYAYERTQAWSCSLWYKLTASNGTHTMFFGKTANYNLGYEVWHNSTNYITFHITNTQTSNEIRVDSTSTYTDTTNWHHWVFTYNGGSNTSGMKIYYDGQSAGISSVVNNLSATVVNASASFCIGSRNGAYSKGKFDEMGWWSRELTSTEVTTLYNGGTGLFY